MQQPDCTEKYYGIVSIWQMLVPNIWHIRLDAGRQILRDAFPYSSVFKLQLATTISKHWWGAYKLIVTYFYIANEMPQLRVACSEFLLICYKTQLDFLIRPSDILRGIKLSHTDMCSYHAGQRYGPPGIIFQSQ